MVDASTQSLHVRAHLGALTRGRVRFRAHWAALSKHGLHFDLPGSLSYPHTGQSPAARHSARLRVMDASCLDSPWRSG